MAELTPAERLQRDRLALTTTIDSVVVAARHWRHKPEDDTRRLKFLQFANQAERRAIALDELTRTTEQQPKDGDHG